MARSESYLFDFFIAGFGIKTLPIYLAGSETYIFSFFYDWIQYLNPANIFGWV
jgi:hypothetical protein